MQLIKLSLYNFRNFKNIKIEPNNLFNIFYGDNAEGKTNILESISLLGSLKSFRSARNNELVKIGEKKAVIKGVSLNNQVSDEISLSIDKDRKTARLNGKIVSQPENYLDCLRPVVFSPEEVSVTKGGPSGRRRLIDRAVFQSTPIFLKIFKQYERQLKQRNMLLKERKSELEIIPWTDSLIDTGSKIRFARKKYIESISSDFFDCYKLISGSRENIKILYQNRYDCLDDIKKAFREELLKNREQEIKYGITLCGPHRDDIFFYLNDKSLREFGSQGQQRSFILALKTAQVINLEKEYGEPPLLLLDDLLGELDQQRQDFFFQFLFRMQGQIFITTTDIKPLEKSGINRASYFNVKDGVLHIRQN